MAVAKLFWSGNSQALRLPKSFRFNSKSVFLEKQGNRVIIEPIVENWDWLDELTISDPTFEQATAEKVETQERNWSCFE